MFCFNFERLIKNKTQFKPCLRNCSFAWVFKRLSTTHWLRLFFLCHGRFAWVLNRWLTKTLITFVFLHKFSFAWILTRLYKHHIGYCCYFAWQSLFFEFCITYKKTHWLRLFFLRNCSFAWILRTFANDALVAVVFLRNNSFVFILKR